MRAILGHVGVTKVEIRGGGKGARALVLLSIDSGGRDSTKNQVIADKNEISRGARK